MRCDVDEFREALAQEDFAEALRLHASPFLSDTERKQRLELSDSFSEWLLAEREELLTLARDASLRQAERQAAQDDFERAAAGAWAAYKAYLSERTVFDGWALERMHTLLLAGAWNHTEIVRQKLQGLEHPPLYTSFEAARTALRSPHNLPLTADPWFGREAEVQRLREGLLFGARRLVTILGEPGVGKTRLAVEVGRSLRGYRPFRHGVFLVPLEALRDAEEVPSAIAAALELSLSGAGSTVDKLARALGNEARLLLLDNFEHLLNAQAFLTSLLHACPNLSMVVTSRTVLGHPLEWRYPLSALSFPQVDILMPEPKPQARARRVSVQEALSYGAVQVFCGLCAACSR